MYVCIYTQASCFSSAYKLLNEINLYWIHIKRTKRSLKSSFSIRVDFSVFRVGRFNFNERPEAEEIKYDQEMSLAERVIQNRSILLTATSGLAIFLLKRMPLFILIF